MKLISWNVNGLRAVVKKNFIEFVKKESPDILCLQETKLQQEQLPELFTTDTKLKSYHQFWAHAEKKGYSGVGILSKMKPISVQIGMGVAEMDKEGRVLALEFKDFYFIGCYFPNSQHGLLRLDYKMEFNRQVLKYFKKCAKKKPIVVCGDFNVAHEEIDLKNPKSNENNPGFYIDERNWFSELVNKKNEFVDSFRHFYPGEGDHYSWWSYRFDARARNIGWRIDYFVVSKKILQNIKKSWILNDVMGSDHCPVGIEFKK